MSNSNGKIYIDTSVTPNKGISIRGDIAAVLGRATGDLGQLCGDVKPVIDHYDSTTGEPVYRYDRVNAINKWAKNKPVRYNSLTTPTDAQKVDVLYGLSIPTLGILNFAQRFSERWGYNAPRGKAYSAMNPTYYNEWFRVLDFNGYLHKSWPVGPVGSNTRLLQTVFRGMLSIPGELISDLDIISFSMQCKENAEMDEPGLIYPYDFIGAVTEYQLAQYYLGIAIVDSQSVVWIISGPKLSDYFGDNPYTGMYATIINSINNGPLTISPVLLEHNTIPSGQSDPQWTSGYNGTIVTFDGAYLPSSKVQQSNNFSSEVTFTYSGGHLTLHLTITNNTGNPVTVNNLVCYILSAAADSNEHDNGYPGPDYKGEGAHGYIYRTWPQNYKSDDIYSHDWIDGYSNPDQRAARFYNAYIDFYRENGNSNVIGNNTTRTWDYEVKTSSVWHTDDDFGAYANGIYAQLCLSITGNSFVREYKSY